VATTPESKAIGIAASLAASWGESYTPRLADRISWHSAVDGCFPAFLSVACAVQIVTIVDQLCWRLIPNHKGFGAHISSFKLVLQERALPPVVGAISAQQTSGLGEIGIIGGALIGTMSHGSVACALIAGNCFGLLSPRLLATCARASIPATATTLACSGGLAVSLGFFTHVLAPKCEIATSTLRNILQLCLSVKFVTNLTFAEEAFNCHHVGFVAA